MLSSQCMVKIIRKNSNTIYLSRALFKELQNSKKSVTVRFGQHSVKAQVRRLKQSNRSIVLPLNLKTALKLPKGGTCKVKIQNNEIQIGPVIGIMTGVINRPASPFGSRTEYIKQIMRAGNKSGIIYAFTPRSINWEDGTVIGYFLNKAGNFTRRKVSLPDVVHNRLPSRAQEKSAQIIQIKERLMRRRIPLFNWSFFDKWDVYHMLEGTSEAKKYVPESIIGPSSDQIKQMLEHHKFIYLKPTSGSLGKGIYRLTHNSKKGYFARFRRNGKNVLLRFKTFSDMMKLLGYRKGRLSKYVAQQGVRLVEIDKCPIDFRYHLVKNGQGKWVVAGIGAKKAGRGAVTTHIRSGGRLLTPEQALRRIYNDEQASKVLSQSKEAAIKLAEAIERNYPYLLGELGLDIGIDNKNHIWMFEANAKPGRSIFKHPSLKEQGKSTIHYLIEYCSYLSSFGTGRREQ